jgi:hypothetical protein
MVNISEFKGIELNQGSMDQLLNSPSAITVKQGFRSGISSPKAPPAPPDKIPETELKDSNNIFNVVQLGLVSNGTSEFLICGGTTPQTTFQNTMHHTKLFTYEMGKDTSPTKLIHQELLTFLGSYGSKCFN